MATALHSTRTRFFDKCGKPLCGGTVHTYQVGTTTDKPTYTDVSKTAVNTNPVILDSIGSAAIFLDGAYRVRVLDRNGVLVEDIAYIESWISATETDNIYQGIDDIDVALNNHAANTQNPHQVSKAQIGLGNVDNTADLDKPVSTATKSYIDQQDALKADIATTYTKTEVDSKVNAVSGGYIGAFATLSELNAKTGMTAGQVAKVMNDTTATNNGDYRYTGSAWVKGYDNSAEAKSYADAQDVTVLTNAKSYADNQDSTTLTNAKSYADTQDATTLNNAKAEIAKTVQQVVVSKNLADPAQVQSGYTLNSSGAVVANSSYKVTGFIPALANTSYAKAATNGMWAEYDSNKQFIKFYDTNVAKQIVTQSNTAFIRTSFLTSQTAEVQKIGVIYDTDAYATKNNVVNEYLQAIVVKAAIAPNSNKLDKTIQVSARQLDFLTRNSPNLFDSNRYYPNTKMLIDVINNIPYVNYQTQQYYWVSQLVEVEPSTVYTISGYQNWVQYDANMNVIAYDNTAYLVKKDITTVANAAYLQWCKPYSAGAVSDSMLTLASEYPSTIVPYNRYIETIQVLDSDEQQWVGKQILWMGTSIPAGAGYSEAVARNLLAKVNNQSRGGGRIGAFKDGTQWDGQANFVYNFTLAKADVNARYSNMLGKTVKSADYLTEDASGVVLTQAMLDALTADNYESRLLPNIATTDLFIIDYGINDRNLTSTYPLKTVNELLALGKQYDRGYFAGAMGFIIKQIIDAKQAANVKTYQIVIVGHYAHSATHTNADDVINAQKDVANYYGLPFINLADNMGINALNIAKQTGDGLHYNAGTGPLTNRVTRFITAKLKEIDN